MTFLRNVALTALYSCVLIVFLVSTLSLISAVARADVLHNLQSSTMKLNTGTGFIVKGKSGKSYILTNWHVCVSSSQNGTLVGKLYDKTEMSGSIVANDPVPDLCAAKISYNTHALKISDKNELGELYTVGYPFGVRRESHGVAKERVSWDYAAPFYYFNDKCPVNSTTKYYKDGSIESCVMHWTAVITSLFSRPGSSGSPAVDEKGQLVGVISSHDSPNNDFSGGMVPIEQLREFLDKL